MGRLRNELNAAYAADGYARIGGAAILTTTYVAGEASALNGVLGSKAERLPVFHLVGMPSSRLIRTRRQLHHTFGDGELDQFRVPSELAACVSAALTPENAVQELERVIEAALHERQPAYITIPYDYGHMPVIGRPVKGLPLGDVTSAHSDQVELEGAIKAILAALATARRPVILAAFTLARYGVTLEATALVEAIGVPFAATSMDKGVLPESHPLYAGQYAGEASTGEARRLVEEADLVLDLGGVILDDTDTGLSARLDAAKIVTIGPGHVSLGARADVGGPGPKTFGPVAMKDVLTRLTRESPRFEKPAFERPSGVDTEVVAEDPLLGNDDVGRVRVYDRLPAWRYSSVPAAMGCSGWFTPVVRTNGELQAALQRARNETHPSYIEVRLEHKLVTAMSRPDFERQYQISEPSSEAWRPAATR